MANSVAGDGSGLKQNNTSAADSSDAAAQRRMGHGRRAELEIRAPRLPKIAQGFVPLSLLIRRLVQDSFNELQLMMDSITSAGMSSEEKKTRILKYATVMRKQFIKMLVLVKWANDAGAVSDVIDLKAWLDGQHRVFDNVVFVLCEIRRQLGLARIPNPDLETAIEVLSTGAPSIVTTKRYVPPPPLTSSQTLDILRSINAVLAIRLGLHETLPPHFRDYKVASGRATFTVADEFEVDLSIGDENPESQLYVIDVRPLFEPAARPLPPLIFRELEARGNQILLTKGLNGIYEFLHDYFLTSKIMTLQKQAQEMLKGRWTENLKVQVHKRTLAVQYWPNKPDDKSWIEVGVRRGTPSRLGVRWVREGSEVKDLNVPMDVANLSAETLMKSVIAMHTKHILTTLRNKLRKSPLFTVPGTMGLKTHPTDSFESYLMIRLTPSRQVKVLVEPITGRFALQKPSERNARMEYEMNYRPANSHEQLLRFKFMSMQEEVESRGKSMGWEILKTLSIRNEDLKQNFPSNSRYMLHMRRKGWCKNWVITFVQQDTGESWWATEIQEKPSQWSISVAARIHIKCETTNATYRFLENLEKMAAGYITHYVNSRYLEQQGTLHRFIPSSVQMTRGASAIQIPDLYVRFSSLIKGDWAIDVLQIAYQGLSTQDGLCRLVVLGRTKEPMTQLSGTNIVEEEKEVCFHPQTGSYAMKFTVAVGETVIAQIMEKLYRIERLIQVVRIIRSFKLNCVHVSLSRIIFRYSNSPEISAEINLKGEDSGMTLTLPKNSPHIRMHQILQETLDRQGLETVIKGLVSTLPLLISIDKIEASVISTPAEHSFFVLTRDLGWFRIEYTDKNHVLDCRLRRRRNKLYWYVTNPTTINVKPERIPCESVKQLWYEDGDGWEGLNNGIAAELRAVGEVIEKCHQILINAPVVHIPIIASTASPSLPKKTTLQVQQPR